MEAVLVDDLTPRLTLSQPATPPRTILPGTELWELMRRNLLLLGLGPRLKKPCGLNPEPRNPDAGGLYDSARGCGGVGYN